VKFLLDQGTPRSTVALLRAAGHDAVHTGDIGMATAEDGAILAAALSEGRVVVTLDADFHALLALSGASLPSVIRLRDQGLKGDDVAALLLRLLPSCEADLLAGAVVSVEQGLARLRRLPLVPPTRP
jgi:predicted nuclease of predicted toxin-antitoxin system